MLLHLRHTNTPAQLEHPLVRKAKQPRLENGTPAEQPSKLHGDTHHRRQESDQISPPTHKRCASVPPSCCHIVGKVGMKSVRENCTILITMNHRV